VPPELRSAVESALRRSGVEVQGILSSARFREAITWQNREVLAIFDSVLAHQPARRSKSQREKELRIASYWQRYSVKNDAIGSFGPCGWARFADAGEVVSAAPGPGLVRRRQVFFEGWAVDVLAETIASDPRMRPWMAPRRMPFLHVDGLVVHRLYSPPLTLTAAEAAVLEASDGTRTARDVAAVARRDAATGLMTGSEVYRVIAGLQARGLLSWAIDLPTELVPERGLVRALERIADEPLRAWSMGLLAELERDRAAVALAADDQRTLSGALEALDQTFTRLTTAEASRNPGRTYGSKRVVYEDCCRDLDVDLGPLMLAELAAPLSLVLASARWVTHQLAATYREAFTDVYRDQVRRTGNTVVELAQFPFLTLLDMASGRAGPILQSAAERWAAILDVDPDQRRVCRSSAELGTAVTRAFDAPGPGWPLARYHSPDLMIDSPSLEAIQAGDFQLVLGEVHLAVNSLLVALQVGQHPCPADLRRWVDSDLPEPVVVGVIPKSWERTSSRLYLCLDSAKDLYLSMSADAGRHDPSRGLPVASLVLEESGRGLRARTRDGTLELDVIELFGLHLAGLLLNGFGLHPPRRHLPRVTIDRLVVCRESWTLPPAELTCARAKDEVARFVATRAWAHGLQLPRFVFVRSPIEVKPVFVDFASPLYVNQLCKLVRALEDAKPQASVTLTEMLPDPAHAWLPDAEGNLYTCELRVVAVDQRQPAQTIDSELV
jgi:hypothetical protein